MRNNLDGKFRSARVLYFKIFRSTVYGLKMIIVCILKIILNTLPKYIRIDLEKKIALGLLCKFIIPQHKKNIKPPTNKNPLKN